MVFDTADMMNAFNQYTRTATRFKCFLKPLAIFDYSDYLRKYMWRTLERGSLSEWLSKITNG